MHPLIQVTIGIFLADFLIAFFHWLEDTYFSYCMRLPIISTIAKDNEMHHYFPRDIVYYSYIQNMTVTLPLSIIFMLIFITAFPRFVSTHKYLFITFFIIGAIANILHKYTHMRDCELPLPIILLHKLNILVDHQHHKRHHETPNHKYGVLCPITNRVLDTIAFWRILEKLVLLITGVPPSVKPSYTDYVNSIDHTQMHDDAKSRCPPKINRTQLETLKHNLDKYYVCSSASFA